MAFRSSPSRIASSSWRRRSARRSTARDRARESRWEAGAKSSILVDIVIGTAHKEILATNKKQAHLRRQEGDDMAHVRSGGLLTALPLVLCLLAAGQPAQAQDKYPSKPVRVLVPYAPGGAVDIIARIVTDHMRQTLGQAFVIENKPGAFGILAIEEMARAKPDGHTLMIGNVTSNAITPVL